MQKEVRSREEIYRANLYALLLFLDDVSQPLKET